ncbi:methylglyoxal synthase-like domain-containing protein [Pavlovales sp. CCMP2436]|nr:methylglyoxal synthase-like domain-containing protein [Pavlovales sp. CCMP2436]
MVGEQVKPAPINLLDIDYVGIKAPMFSFTRLIGADPVLGVEMASTGEVATFGDTRHEAIITSMLSAGFRIPEKSVFLCIGPLSAKLSFVESAKLMVAKGLILYASPGTHAFFTEAGVATTLLHKPSSSEQPNFVDYIIDKIDLVINIRDTMADSGSISDGYSIRRSTVDRSVGLLTDLKLAKLIITAFTSDEFVNDGKVKVRAWDELGN